MGPGLGEAGPASNFLVYSRPARGLLMLMMLAGRLEIFPILVLLSRLFGPTGAARPLARRPRRLDSWWRSARRTG